MTLQFQHLRSGLRHVIFLGAVLLASAVYPQTFGKYETMRGVVTATDAWIPQPAAIIAAGQIENIAPDPLGRFALVTQLVPMYGPELGAVNLLLYDSHTGRVKTVWQQAEPEINMHQPRPEESNIIQGKVQSVDWFPDSNTVIAAVVTNKITFEPGGRRQDTPMSGELLLIHATQTSRSVTTILQGTCVVYGPSRPGNVAVAMVWDLPMEVDNSSKVSSRIRFVTVNSKGQVDELPEIGRSNMFRRMSADGSDIYFRSWPNTKLSYEEDKKNAHYTRLNLVTRKTEEVTAADAEAADPVSTPHREPELRLVSSETVAQSPSVPPPSDSTPLTTLLKPLYLVRNGGTAKSRLPKSVMVAPHADASLLLADNSAVLYKFQGTLYAAPLLRLPLSDFRRHVIDIVSTNARNIGFAMSQYAADYDGYLPLSSTPFTAPRYIYDEDTLKDPSTGETGFRYLLDGQNQAGLKGNKDTIAGYLDSAFGSATIYADGHVVWVDAD